MIAIGELNGGSSWFSLKHSHNAIMAAFQGYGPLRSTTQVHCLAHSLQSSVYHELRCCRTWALASGPRKNPWRPLWQRRAMMTLLMSATWIGPLPFQ